MKSKVERRHEHEGITNVTNENQLDEVTVVDPGPRRWRHHLRDLGKAPSLGRASMIGRKVPMAIVSARRISSCAKHDLGRRHVLASQHVVKARRNSEARYEIGHCRDRRKVEKKSGGDGCKRSTMDFELW